jgi:hypothetical protein
LLVGLLHERMRRDRNWIACNLLHGFSIPVSLRNLPLQGYLWDAEFFLVPMFSCKIELILVKFLRDSCEIPTFQREPKSS